MAFALLLCLRPASWFPGCLDILPQNAPPPQPKSATLPKEPEIPPLRSFTWVTPVSRAPRLVQDHRTLDFGIPLANTLHVAPIAAPLLGVNLNAEPGVESPIRVGEDTPAAVGVLRPNPSVLLPSGLDLPGVEAVDPTRERSLGAVALLMGFLHHWRLYNTATEALAERFSKWLAQGALGCSWRAGPQAVIRSP